MQENYFLSKIRRIRVYYYCRKGIEVYQNLLNINCKSIRPNQKWGTDISYIKTKKGNVYLSVIKDLFDNFIVTYHVSKIQSQQLVSQTINKAKNNIKKGLILHSDRGWQYISLRYKELLDELYITPSMSSAGSTNRQKIQDIQHATKIIDEFIEYYNYQRIQLKTKQTPFQLKMSVYLIFIYR